MTFSASSLSVPGPAMTGLKRLDKRLGIEIFYEFASEDMWTHVLDEAMEGREGEFSIHSPFFYADICYTPEEALFRELRTPFALYRRFHGRFYVLHSQGQGALPADAEGRARLRERVAGRVARFAHICREEGVVLAVENLFGPGGPLFDQEQYIELIRRTPEARALIDVGHALIAGYDVPQVQAALGERLIAYHVHDNDGRRDAHLRVGAPGGSFDWAAFARGFRAHTPQAALVLEYAHAAIGDYAEDMEKLKGLIQGEGTV